jgi:putative endonuclease
MTTVDRRGAGTAVDRRGPTGGQSAGGGQAVSEARRRTGRLGEDAAAAYLDRAGWTILHRNYRCSQGEIDVVAWDGDELVFLEVRARSSSTFGAPEEALTRAKARKVACCALAYLQERGHDRLPWRIDFVAVSVTRGRVTRLEHFRHALQ